MIRRSDLAKRIGKKMPCVRGYKIPTYLCETIVDIVFDSIKEALIEDGDVSIKNQFSFKRIDVPEHMHRMPDGAYIIIPHKSKVQICGKDKFVSDITNEVRRRKMLNTIGKCHAKVERGTHNFSNKERVEIQKYLDGLNSIMSNAINA